MAFAVEKTIRIKNSVYVSIALGIRHAMRMRRIILSSVACLTVLYFFHIVSETAQLSGEGGGVGNH